jgi:hypothetical protein
LIGGDLGSLRGISIVDEVYLLRLCLAAVSVLLLLVDVIGGRFLFTLTSSSLCMVVVLVDIRGFVGLMRFGLVVQLL